MTAGANSAPQRLNLRRYSPNLRRPSSIVPHYAKPWPRSLVNTNSSVYALQKMNTFHPRGVCGFNREKSGPRRSLPVNNRVRWLGICRYHPKQDALLAGAFLAAA